MRGGKREGAGRKPRKVSRKALTIRVEPKTLEKFNNLCEAKERSQSELFTEWVERMASGQATELL